MNYGKFTDGKLETAGSYLKADGREYFNPPDELKIKLGYLPMTDTEMPVKDGFYFTSEWQEKDGQIVQVWAEHEIVTEETETDPVTTELAALKKTVEEQAGKITKLESDYTKQAATLTTLDSKVTEQTAKITALDTSTVIKKEVISK